MPSAAEVAAYRRRQRRLAVRASADLAKQWASLSRLAPTLSAAELRDSLGLIFAGLVEQYGAAAASNAADWFEQLVGESATLARPVPTDQTDAIARWALGPTFEGDPAGTLARLDAAIDRLMHHAAADTIATSSQRHGTRWARVPSGPRTCGFCTMLASRGPVYTSQHSASRASDGTSYHDHCDCVPVPMRGPEDYPNGYADQLAGWRADYENAVAEVGGDPTEIAKAIDAANAPPDQNDRAAWLDYWSARQARLGVDTHGERLEPHEVEFVERFLAAGHRLTWIPRDSVGHTPTNDFRWLTNGGIPVEVKATSARYRSVQHLVKGAVSRARVQGVTKENFIIDLGDRPLSDKLLGQLALYNRRNPDNAIARLWVMSRGALVEVPQT